MLSIRERRDLRAPVAKKLYSIGARLAVENPGLFLWAAMRRVGRRFFWGLARMPVLTHGRRQDIHWRLFLPSRRGAWRCHGAELTANRKAGSGK